MGALNSKDGSSYSGATDDARVTAGVLLSVAVGDGDEDGGDAERRGEESTARGLLSVMAGDKSEGLSPCLLLEQHHLQ